MVVTETHEMCGEYLKQNVASVCMCGGREGDHCCLQAPYNVCTLAKQPKGTISFYFYCVVFLGLSSGVPTEEEGNAGSRTLPHAFSAIRSSESKASKPWMVGCLKGRGRGRVTQDLRLLQHLVCVVPFPPVETPLGLPKQFTQHMHKLLQDGLAILINWGLGIIRTGLCV